MYFTGLKHFRNDTWDENITLLLSKETEECI